ncbi:MAG TPA: hypothetical protein VF691_11825 [Cytophagaceae bacterium]
MRKLIVLSLIFLGSTFLASAQYKVDSMCGAKVILDKNGKLLSRYKPQNPGYGYITAVKTAVDFWKTCPISPKNKLPLYLTHCSMYRDGKGGFYGSDWPHNPIVVNGGIVQSLAIDWRNYSGDESMLDLARAALDHQIKYGTTPANWEWASVPYASSEAGEIIYDGASKFDTAKTEENIGRGDGSFALEVDKIGEMGIHYLKFYEITGEQKYLTAAIQCADALAKHVRVGVHKKAGLEWKSLVLTSPWPFRVKAEKGEILESYTSHVVENLRLLEGLNRIQSVINLPSEKVASYKRAADIVWNWLYSAEGAIKTGIWKGYFEDIRVDEINLNRVNNSPMEFARYLIKNPKNDKDIDVTVPGLIWFVKTTFKESGMNAINEQTGCYLPMGSHTARYASICAMWYEYTKDEAFKEEAYRYFNHATYMAEPDGVVQTGHNWGTEIWFSDGYTDYIRHFMEGLAAIPEWVPAEDHLLRSTSTVKKIKYEPSKITFNTFDKQSEVVLRMSSKPKTITVSGKALAVATKPGNEGYTWKALAQGGVLTMKYTNGTDVAIVK